MTPEQIALLKEWRDTKALAVEATAKEKVLRAQVVASLFPDAVEGTNNLDIGGGWKLKYVKGTNYSLDKGDLDPNTGLNNTDRALDVIRSTSNEGPFIADRLVKFKPELSISEYKLLSDTHKKIINKVITTSEASPELSMVPPKT